MFNFRELIKVEDIYGNHVTAVIHKSPAPCSGNNFLLKDFTSKFPYVKIVEILDVFVYPKYRHKGTGSLMLQELLSKCEDSVVLLSAGAHTKEYEREPTGEKFKEALGKVVSFYNKNGFIDINDIMGGYQYRRAMLYTGNSLGKYFEEKLKTVAE